MTTERDAIKVSPEQLLDAAPDGMVIIDDAGVIRLVNRQAEALFGYSRDELLGQHVEVLVPERVQGLHPGHRAAYFGRPVTRPMGAGLELAARRKDGTEFPVDISLSSLDTDEGVWVTAAVRDVTDRKRSDDERAQLQVQLERARQEEERALLEAKLHQAQRLESVGQLAGGVAHDFNNLLAGIMSYATLVSRALTKKVDAAGVIPPDVRAQVTQDVEEIVTTARRATDLVHQLLVFSRRDVVNPQVVDLNEVVRDMEKLLRRTIGEHIELVTALDPALPRTRSDRGQLEQVLLNLVVNARDAMPQGGRLEIQTESIVADETYATGRAVTPGPYLRLTVSDTGTGMPPEVASRAFEPFFTTKPQGSGSGLGLATIYGIVTQAGGDVMIYSEPGLGTTIRVILPATDAEATTRREPAAEPVADAVPATVLLVEDEQVVRVPAQRLLEEQGYRVLAASDAKEALELLDRGPVDLLLTDVVMPGLSGKDLADEVAQRSPGTKVLFMSGYSHGIIAHQGVLEAGVDLIEKPFVGEALLRRVREALDR